MLLTVRIYFAGDRYFLTPFVRRYQISPSSYSFIPQQNSSVYQMLFPMGCLPALFFPSSFRHILDSGVRVSWVVTLNLICLLFLQNNAKILCGTYNLQDTPTNCLFPDLQHNPGRIEAVQLVTTCAVYCLCDVGQILFLFKVQVFICKMRVIIVYASQRYRH